MLSGHGKGQVGNPIFTGFVQGPVVVVGALAFPMISIVPLLPALKQCERGPTIGRLDSGCSRLL